MLPHTAGFIDQARTALDMMPPANHLDDWRLLLDDLEHAATECRRILDIEPVASDEKARRAQDAALWPYVTTWAEHGYLVDSLINQLHPVAPAPVPSDTEQRRLTQQVHDARSHGRLDIVRTWWDTAGRLISLVRIEGRNPLLALAGDLDSPGLEILGRFDDEDEAIGACPPAAPAGVLRPDVSSADTIPPIQTTVPGLTRWVIEARVGVDVGIALLAVTHPEDAALPAVRTLLDTAREYAAATQTRQGAHLAARLEGLSSRLHALGRELHQVGHEMMNANAVLPPHRTPQPRHLPPQRDDDRPHPGPANAHHLSAPAAPPGPVSDAGPAPGTRRRS
ncbi:hypothetical protein AA958_18810 [Streptomyces sp. CNQ-509]|uniref:hypothetical protein n=1 Tax=Streptomyces sp. CNQ-509 TaxID=444103 RepID=UPI00062DD99A|nr:hypothetical protein [Streptomyces sp. CNQ-509]AKH83908.1 hypothetical protein AA958_18810 [Streptomyces sp. CNQ-509]